MGDNIKMHL